jgi:hypothetical protein
MTIRDSAQMSVIDARTHYVLSVKWTRGPVVTWWGPDRCGYVQRLTDAGRYTEAEAREIERSTHGDSVALPIAVVDAKAAPVVFDFAVGDLIRERQRAHRCGYGKDCEVNARNERAAIEEPQQ